MRPRGEGYEVRVEAGNGRGGLFRGRSGEYRVRDRGAPWRDGARTARLRGHLGPRKLCGPRHQGRIGRRRVRGRVRRGRRQQPPRATSSSTASARRRSTRPPATSGSTSRPRGRREHGIGDVAIDSVVSGDVRVNSASGDIEVGIAKGSRLLVDAQTLSGDTSSELDLESGNTIETDEGPLVELKARSMSGDISVKRA